MGGHDGLGGPPQQQAPAAYAGSPPSVLAWRLRLGGASILVVHLMAGESVTLLFAGCLVLSAVILAAGTGMARLEARVHALHRQERRR